MKYNRTKNWQALGRLKAGAMNRTEQAYANVLASNSDVTWFKFEGLKLRLADNTFYSPDFAVLRASGEIEIHEVKGFWQDDARVKIKIAADMYPFKFIAVKYKNKQWIYEEF